MWISGVRGGMEEEIGAAGRMGRFNRKFGSGVGNVAVGSTSTGGQVGMEEGKVEESVGVEGGESEKEVKTQVKEDVVDLTGMGMDMGMGGSLDDVMWYEDMAKMTGGEPSAPVKPKKEKEEKKEKGKEKEKEKKGKK
jgi:hypothetical protein